MSNCSPVDRAHGDLAIDAVDVLGVPGRLQLRRAAVANVGLPDADAVRLPPLDAAGTALQQVPGTCLFTFGTSELVPQFSTIFRLMKSWLFYMFL